MAAGIVTVVGGAKQIVDLPFNSAAGAAVASALLSGLYSAYGSGSLDVITASGGGTPSGTTEFFVDTTAATVPSGAQYVAIAPTITGGAVSVSGGTTGFTLVTGDMTNVDFIGGSGAATVISGGGVDSLGSSGSALNSAAFDSNTTGILTSGNWIAAGIGGDTITAGVGSSSVVFTGGADNEFIGGAGQALVADLGSADSVVGGSGAETVFALGSNLSDSIGSGSLVFVASVSGGSNGVDSVTATASSGAATLFGGAGTDVTFSGPTSNNIFVAGSGNATLNAANASGNNIFFGGSGNDSIQGGTGTSNDFFIAGTGAATFSGGTGIDQYLFLDHPGSTATDLITNWATDPNDQLYLVGYTGGGSGLPTGIASENVAGGSLTVTLTDGTSITFKGQTSDLNSSQVHSISNT